MSNIITTTIKNQINVDYLLSTHKWVIDPEQKINPGQINYIGDSTSWYDAETDKLDGNGSGYAQCESCNTIYLYADEPAEVKEGGTHICPDCWAIEE